MAFADPQSVTISGVTTSLPRISSGANASIYKSNDGLITLTASNAYGKRTRRTIRLNVAKISADPYLPAANIKTDVSTYIVFDIPPAGFTVAEVTALFTGFSTLLNASSAAAVTKLLGGEN